jgi:hypothetical protein
MTGRPRIWTEEKLNRVKDLAQHNSMSEIGKIFNTTKNAILGALYKDKIKNGYVPPPDSKYTGRKNLYSERKRNFT